MCEDFPADPIPLTDEGSGLTFIVIGLEKGDKLAVDINGTAVASEHLRWTWYDDEGRPPTCKIALESPPFVYGDNHLGLRIVKSAEGGEGHVKVERVECMVRASCE